MDLSKLPGFKYLVKNHSTSYLVIILLLFAVGSVISIVNWGNIKSRANHASINKYVEELNQSKSVITQSLNQYSLLLDDGTSLLAANNNNVNQNQWLTFFKSYNLANNYPGVDAVSFGQYVMGNQLAGYLSNLTSQGQPNFTITPPGSRNVYVPVTYIGYVSPTSLQAMGYDQFSNPVRRAAILQAINSGKVTMSGIVSLVAVNKGQSAFLIYKPVYSGQPSTQDERQSSIFGFTFIAVNSNDFFHALLSRYMGPGIAIQIYDGKTSSSNLLFETTNYGNSIKHIASPVSSLVAISYGGQTWNIKVIIARRLLLSSESQSSVLDLIAGITISALAAGVLWYFTYYRERKIYWHQQKEVQAAKDELLSLASHQLRTPATIVKQYLGILLQNYSGALTKQQRKVVKTAYDSNERQLEIANQFLDAARLDSGRIALNIKPVVLNNVIDQVVSDQQKLAKGHQQKVIFNKPKRSYKIKGDPKYLAMVFENLINNSIKYSKPRTNIDVAMSRSGSDIYITVNDHGIGITPDDISIIFEKFSRATNEQNAGGNGTGIGLYLANQIVNLHKGSISVESTPGKGSKFTVKLPTKS
jgi:two-component system OmpR family sensor kinase